MEHRFNRDEQTDTRVDGCNRDEIDKLTEMTGRLMKGENGCNVKQVDR